MLIAELNQSQLKNAKLELQEVYKIKPVSPLLPKWGNWELIPSHNKLLVQIDTTPFIDQEYCFQLHILEKEYYYTHIYNLGSMSQELVSEYETLLNGYLLPFIETTQKFNTFLNTEKSLLKLGQKYNFTNKGYIKEKIKMKNLKEYVRGILIENLEDDYIVEGSMLSELPYYVFIEGQYIIYEDDGKQLLNNYGGEILDIINNIQKDTGTVMDLSNAYIWGNEVLYRVGLQVLCDVRDRKLWSDNLEEIISELKGEI